MSTAATAEAEAPAAKGGGKKKLLIIIGAVLVLVLGGGGGAAFYVMKKRQAAAEAAAAEDGEPVAKKKKDEKKTPPAFLPLDIFTVNLADRDAERYAQVGVTLELADAAVGDKLKAYMPAIRNDILMLLAHKTAAELQEKDGKLELAAEIKQAASKPLSDGDDHAPKKKKAKDDHDDDEDSPVRAVHFSAFIIQ